MAYSVADNHVRVADRLREEAQAILAQTKLLDILRARGPTDITGSYAYDLMTRRDIDVCLAVTEPTVALAFSIGEELAHIPGVGSLYYPRFPRY